MKISEVMRETNLTKKAIYYFEAEGLIRGKRLKRMKQNDTTERLFS